MAIAIIDHDNLQVFIKGIDFPYNHRINLVKGGVGFKMFDEFIRANVRWIQEMEYKKDKHVKLWSSSNIVGNVPNIHEFYSRSVVTGTEEVNPLTNGLSPALPNYNGSVHLLSLKYIADYKEVDLHGTPIVDVEEYIRVIVTENAADSYLSYGLHVPVETLWEFRYEHRDHNFVVDRKLFGDVNEEWFYVRDMTPQEIEDNYIKTDTGYQRLTNLTTEVKDVEIEPLDITGFAEDDDPQTDLINTMRSTLQLANTIGEIRDKVAIGELPDKN